MNKQDIENITLEFNRELQRIDNNSNAVSAYIGLLDYRRHYLQTIRTYKKGSIEEEMFLTSFLEKANKHFPDAHFSTIQDVISKLEELARPVIDLNMQYQNSLKEYLIASGQELTAVRVQSPESLNGRISCSKNLLSQFEEEQGNWVFASSIPLEENAYLARCQGHGMLGMGKKMYYYSNSALEIKDGRLLINPKGYIYYVKPSDFTPVTTVRRSKTGNPFFIFDDEWTCPHDISLEHDITRIEEFSDVTFLLEHLQLFIGENEEVKKALYTSGGPKRMEILKNAIATGKIQYLNGILNINVLDDFIKRSSNGNNTNDKRREENGEVK